MGSLNYANIDDKEFESLAKDVMNKILSLNLQRFGTGRDGGIDLVDDTKNPTIIVQCKQYSTSTDAVRALLKEKEKLEKYPTLKAYYVFTSASLLPPQVSKLRNHFDKWMNSDDYIIYNEKIEDFFNEMKNIDVLVKHKRLFMSFPDWFGDYSPLPNFEKGSKGIVENNIDNVKENKELEDIDNFSHSTTFFNYRIGKAFPGIRGAQKIDNPEECIERLNVLLCNPLSSKQLQDPIWWFRGGMALPIKVYKSISDGKFFINNDEYVIKKLVVYRSSSYYKDFLYVETKPEESTGVYGDYVYTEAAKRQGFFDEEYGLYKGIPITKQEYNDGSAIIDGKLVVFDEKPILRNRYLTPYNFIICAKYHAFNNRECEADTRLILNGILSGKNNFYDLVSYCEQLGRHRDDF